MTIYVDDLIAYPQKATSGGRFFGSGKQSCHMATDGAPEELHRFAESIGLKREWYQAHRSVSHYDLIPSKRAAAIAKGAVQVSARELVRRCRNPPVIIVGNRHRGAVGEYVGRPSSVLGNPYKLSADTPREVVIARYRDWLWAQIRLRSEVWEELNRLADIAEKQDLTLVCSCAPLACHADIVKAAILWIIKERSISPTSD